MKRWVKKNRIYISSFLIPFIVMTGVCIGCKVEPFGDKSLVIIDGLHQYMPFFSEYQEKLRNMDSLFYSWNGGLGYNFFALWSYYLSSPFNFLVIFFPKTALNMAISWLIVLKISLIGLTTASFLLSRSKRADWMAAAFSTAFALSNYIVGYSWNVMWLDSIIMLPLVLMGFDRLMQKKDGRMYCWTLALAMVGNFYIAFMICIFLVFWFILYPAPQGDVLRTKMREIDREWMFRLKSEIPKPQGDSQEKTQLEEADAQAEPEPEESKELEPVEPEPAEAAHEENAQTEEGMDLKGRGATRGLFLGKIAMKGKAWLCFYLQRGALFGFCSLLSAAMAAIGLIPAYLGIMDTASAKLMALPEHEWFTNLFDIMSTHLALTTPVTNNNFDGNANLYVGILPILLFCLYLSGRRIEIGDKIKRLLFAAVFVVSFNEKILNFIWHGFHDQYGIPNRFAFLYLFLLIVTGYEAVQKWKAMRFVNLFFALAAAFLLISLLIYRSDREVGYLSIGFSMGLAVFYGWLLLAYGMRKLKPKICVALLFVVFVAEAGGMAAYGFHENGQIEVPKFFSDTQKISKVKKDIGSGLARTSLMTSKMLDEEIWHNLKCVTMFGSTVSGKAVSMMDHLGFYTGANEYLYKGATPLTNLLLNVKYNICREEDENLNEFELVKSYDGMELLKNPMDTFLGYGVEGDLSEWFYESAYPFRVQNDFVWNAYGVEEIFHDIPIVDPAVCDCEIEQTNDGEYRFTNTSSQADNMVFELPMIGGEDLYIHYDGSQVTNTIIKVDDEIRVDKKINSEIYHIGLIEPGQRVRIYLQLADDDVNSGIVRLSAADFDRDQFEIAASLMQENGFHVETYESDYVAGNITLSENGMIVFSIPYDKGWTVILDGKKTEPVPVAEGLLGVKAGKGGHSLSLSYESPGFRLGLCLSACGIFLFALFCAVCAKIFGMGESRMK